MSISKIWLNHANTYDEGKVLLDIDSNDFAVSLELSSNVSWWDISDAADVNLA